MKLWKKQDLIRQSENKGNYYKNVCCLDNEISVAKDHRAKQYSQNARLQIFQVATPNIIRFNTIYGSVLHFGL